MDEKRCATCDKCSITLNATTLSEKPAPDTYICEAAGIVTNPFAYCIDYRARRDDSTGEPDCGTGSHMTKKTCETCDYYDGWICKIDGFIMGSYSAACNAYYAKRNTGTGEPDCGTGELYCGTSFLSRHRHELGARLRMMSRSTPYLPCDVLLHRAMKTILPEGGNYCNELADLIDPPTCTVVKWEQLVTQGLGELDLDDMFRYNLSCGHEVYGQEAPHHCSVCGAEVIGDDR